MADINLVFPNNNICGDWSFANGDIQHGDDLDTAVSMRLWTWRRAPPGYVPTDPVDGLWGHWSDAVPYRNRLLGSRLWLLLRAKKTQETLNLAQFFAVEALEDLQAAGVVNSVTASASWFNVNFMLLSISLTQPDGTVFSKSYDWAWQTLQTPQIQVPYMTPIIPRIQAIATNTLGNFILGQSTLG